METATLLRFTVMGPCRFVEELLYGEGLTVAICRNAAVLFLRKLALWQQSQCCMPPPCGCTVY